MSSTNQNPHTLRDQLKALSSDLQVRITKKPAKKKPIKVVHVGRLSSASPRPKKTEKVP